MSGNKAILVDTNALIYYFNGNEKVTDAIDGEILYISDISEIELLSFSQFDAESEQQIRYFIEDENCRLIELISSIEERTIQIRRRHRIKLPDAVIAATALFLEYPD